MNCGREDCTGVHAHHGPESEMCPGAVAKKRNLIRERGFIIGTPEYNQRHGIGEVGKKRREWAREQYWTPGSRVRNSALFGGDPQEARAIAQAKLDNVLAELAETEALIERLEEEERG